jgi:rhodanese-related sulfurtransferase
VAGGSAGELFRIHSANDMLGGEGRALPAFCRLIRDTAAMPTSVKQLMEAANAAVPRVTPAQARDMMAKGDTLVVDVRDAPEVEKSGKVAGAVNVSRGMLEFRADPESPYHDRNFTKDKTVLVYCASGGRSALSGKTLKDMGYERVYNLGAIKDWAESGGAVDKAGEFGS